MCSDVALIPCIINAVAGLLIFLGIAAVVLLVSAITLLVIAFRQTRHLDIPRDADFFETMRLIPITVPLALDMLDAVFDVLSAPISWMILEAMGLRALQLVTVAEGLIPFTQVLPTLTVAWVIARVTKGSTPSQFEVEMKERQLRRRAADAEGGADFRESLDDEWLE